MRQIATRGIVLHRIEYAEADRILTWLTPDHGKLSLMARGVRKQRSKLAGGIELFSESNISFIRGKGEVGTLTSSRLIKYFEKIVRDLSRTQAGFSFLKIVNRTVEERAGEEWYELIQNALAGLNNLDLPLELTELWFNLHWLKLSGHSPNLQTDTKQNTLQPKTTYSFDFDKMAFFERTSGPYSASHIKLLRLSIDAPSPLKLGRVQKIGKVLDECAHLAKAMLRGFVQI